MNDPEKTLAAIIAALIRESEHTLLQRRVTFVLDEIETVLATGWSLPELAAHVAAAGVTQRDGRKLTSGHFAVMVTRARAKGRAAQRQAHSTMVVPTRRATPLSVPESTNSGTSDIAINLARIAEKSASREAQQAREAAVELNIGTALDAMFGRVQSGDPPSSMDPKASASSALKRPRSRQPR
jgi:hypothetical protein